MASLKVPQFSFAKHKAMAKSNYFSSKSIFGQLISLIDDKKKKRSSQKHDSELYVKRFKSKDHLISMLFSSFAKCNSLREISGAMLGLSVKTESFQLSHIPKRSTLSNANKNRKVTMIIGLLSFLQILKQGLLHE
jgi:hypothetical protein